VNRQTAKDARWQEPDAALEARTQAVVQAAIEVHRQIGPGWRFLAVRSTPALDRICARVRGPLDESRRSRFDRAKFAT
jgi:hypothetical protein